MKKIILIFIYVLSTFTIVKSQSFLIYGDKCFGGNGGEFSNGIIKSNDGNLILSGFSGSNISGNKSVANCNPSLSSNFDIWLLKIDSLFNIIWQKDIGGNLNEGSSGAFNAIIQTSLLDNTFLFSCDSHSDSSCQKLKNNHSLNDVDYWLGLIDSVGNIIWEKTYGGINLEGSPSILRLSTNEYIVCGVSTSPIGGDKTSPLFGAVDNWILKLDSSGNKIWDKTFGGNLTEFNSKLIALKYGGMLLAGSTNSQIGSIVTNPPKGGMDFWIVKIDNDGNEIWDKRYGGINDDYSTDITTTNDGGYLVAGDTYSPQGMDVSEPIKGTAYNSDFWIVKIDSLGNKQWDKRFGGTGAEKLSSIKHLSDGGFLLVGSTQSPIGYDISEPSFGFGSWDYWVIKIDSLGNKVWDKRFGESGVDLASSAVELADSTIILFGIADSGTSAVKTDHGSGGNDYWAVRFKYFPSSVGIEEMNLFNQSVSVFPNPAKDFIKINSQNVPIKKIELVNLLGEILFSQTIENTQTIQLNLQPYQPGFYFVKVSSEKYTVTKRLVKE